CSAANGQRALGLKFTPEEQLRGIPFASTPYSGDRLPSSADLSAQMPPPGNQGGQPSCVAWAVAYAVKSYQEQSELNCGVRQPDDTVNPAHVFSPAFIYNQLVHQGGGMLFEDALDLVHERGVATMDKFPYDAANDTERPKEDVLHQAYQYRIDTWRRVNFE